MQCIKYFKYHGKKVAIPPIIFPLPSQPAENAVTLKLKFANFTNNLFYNLLVKYSPFRYAPLHFSADGQPELETSENRQQFSLWLLGSEKESTITEKQDSKESNNSCLISFL